MADWYQKTGEEALRHFDVTTDGLSSEQAAERLKKDGENVLAEGKKKTVLQVFLGQFADLLVLILIAAAIVSMFSGNRDSRYRPARQGRKVPRQPQIPVLTVRQGYPRRSEN